MSSKITIILLQHVPSLGNKGSIHQVAVPYFNNVLKPKWLAKLADAITINNDQQKKIHDAKEVQARAQALQDLFAQIKEKGNLTIARQCTEMQHLYDKIDTRDICQEILMHYHVKIDKSHIKIDHIIDMIGEYEAIFEWEGLKIKFIINVIKK